MSPAKYRISSEAIQDLRNIWKYTNKKWSKEQADRYFKLVMSEIEFVTTNFHTGKSAEHIREGYRSTIAKSHLIFYKMGKDCRIDIIRILHQKVDVENKLK
ncbi:MAG: toxin ParE1/3/4 [Psychromonas sp.]|jgi:toxin ParE1/3/4